MIMRAKADRLYMVVSPTYPMLSDSTLRSFLAVADELGVVKSKKMSAPMSVTLTTDAEIIFRSGDDPDRLRGPNLSGAWVDEASITDKAVYDLLIPTLREGGEFGWLSATFTPRGKQHWTYDVFATGRPDTAIVTAKSFENPFLPPEFFDTIKQQYGEGSNLARQELYGEFIDDGGLMFRRSWFKIVDNVPDKFKRVVRFWDLAASVPKKLGDDPDWTAGVKIARTEEGQFFILDVRRIRGTPLEVENLVKRTAEEDGKSVGVRMEQEPGASGIAVIDHYARKVLVGYDYKGVKSTGPKEERARPFSAAAENNNVIIKRAQWNTGFLDELEGFPFGPHDDQCLPAGVTVSSARGDIPIEDIIVGEMVLTRNGYQRVKWAGQTGVCDELIEVSLVDGRTISGTPSHPIWVGGAGYRTLREVKAQWQMLKQQCLMEEHIDDTPIRLGGPIGCIFNVIRNGKNLLCTFTENYGSLFTETFRQVILSTISMATRLTTTFQTWNVWIQQSINANMHVVGIIPQKKCATTYAVSATKPPNGIAARQAESGIANTLYGRLRHLGRQISVAAFAVANSRPKGIRLNTAHQNAQKQIADSEAKLGLSTLSVLCVDATTKQGAKSRNFVPIRVQNVRTIKTNVPVYNLTVETTPEFVANGFLVHNCDSAASGFNEVAGPHLWTFGVAV